MPPIACDVVDIKHIEADCPTSLPPQPVSKFRQALPQFLACMGKNLLLFDLGLSFGFPTIVIPVLRGFVAAGDAADEPIHFTAEQSSWYGSIAMLTQPVATVLAGWFTDTFGRRYTMLLVNVPHLAGWLLMWHARSAAAVFAAALMFGIGVGAMETAVIAYVGEIGDQRLRGTLLALSNLSGQLGIAGMYALGATGLQWRQVAAVCATVPAVAALVMLVLPETPYWLLIRERRADAMRSLRWLRGWVAEPHVRDELDSLQHHVRTSMACVECRSMASDFLSSSVVAQRQCPHPSGYWRRALEMRRPNCWRPLVIVALCFVLALSGSLCAIRPYMVQVGTVFRLPVEATAFAAVMGGCELAAHVALLFVVKCVGKRRIFLGASGVSVCAVLALAAEAWSRFPLHATSFDREFVLASSGQRPMDNWLAFGLFVVLAFASGVAGGFPWMLLSEVFPMRNRAAACGVSAAFCYVAIFVTTKSYLCLERALSIGGVLTFYGGVAVAAWIAVYMMLPETEGKTLEAIETHFSKVGHRWCDRRIADVK